MRRRNYRRLITLVFRFHGPLTDAELAWWAGDVLQVNPAMAKRWRYKLLRAGVVRETPGRVRRTPAGRFQKLWELAPGQ